MATRLPLFPLATVLVPGLVLPLHVFEPRYRRLVADLEVLGEDEQVFGVVAARSAGVATDRAPVAPDGDDDSEEGEAGGFPADATAAASAPPLLYEVGCTAQIQEITPHDDGRSDVITVGQERFRIRRLLPDAPEPYLVAEVDLLDEPDGEPDLSYLAELVGLRFAAYRERLRVEQSGVPTDPRVLSYLVSAAAVLELSERQALLEAPTTAERLRTEVTLLRREVGLLDTFAALPAVDLAHQPVAPN